MGTDVHLVVVGFDGAQATAALAEARALIDEAEARLSRFRDDSELSQINRAAGKPTIVSSRTMDVLVAAQQAWRDTDGAYDPTLGAELCWLGYGRLGYGKAVPAAARRRSSAAGELRLDRASNMVVVPDGVVLDLGGIAKGATADAVCEYLMHLGAQGCCANIGGDLRVTGIGPDQGSWTVELACPGSEETRTLRLSDGAVATSSVTKRQWPGVNGPVHHLLDPTTGTSRIDGPLTVSAVAATATAAEVITKWMMAGKSPNHFGATGLRVSRSGRIVHEDGFDAFSVDGFSVDGFSVNGFSVASRSAAA